MTRPIRPAALSDAAVAELVRSKLEPDAPAGFCAACRRATGGNPFFLRELLRTLEAAGIEPSDEAAARLAEIAPETVAKSVLRRLRPLPESALSLARTVAILGSGADPRLAARLADLDEVTVAEAAGALAEARPVLAVRVAGIRAPDREGSGLLEPFPHRSRTGHGRAARLLVDQGAEGDRVAVHLLAAPALHEEWAVDVLRQAAGTAIARGAPEVATAYFERALAEPLSDPARADLLVELAAAEVASLPPPAGIEHMKQALALASDPASAR